MVKISKEYFGENSNFEEIFRVRLEILIVLYVTVLNYGCTITSINVYDKEKKLIDVCLGYKTIEEYERNDGYGI